MRVLIVGGGIGGLTAALCLHDAGVEAVVYESASALRELGVGINLLPHAVRELSALGVQSQLASTAIETGALAYYTRYGRLIQSEPRGLQAGYQWPQFSIHRGRLLMILARAVQSRLGAESIRTGHRFAHFEQDDDGVTAHFVDPATGAPVGSDRGDALIGADGIHSSVRRALYPDEGPPKFSGITMWRGVTEQEPFLDGRTMVITGNWHIRVVVYPISREAAERGRSLINWVAEIRDENKTDWRWEDWDRQGRKADFVPAFGDWRFGWLDVPRLFHGSEAVFEFPMADRDPIARWSFGPRDTAGRCRAPDVSQRLERRGPGDSGRESPDARHRDAAGHSGRSRHLRGGAPRADGGGRPAKPRVCGGARAAPGRRALPARLRQHPRLRRPRRDGGDLSPLPADRGLRQTRGQRSRLASPLPSFCANRRETVYFTTPDASGRGHTMADFDLLVIGGGSGGVACARRAAGYGAKAAVVENDRFGGTCVHRGCIPKKLLVYASHFSHDFEDAAGYGWTVGESAFDWPAMVRAKCAELDRLEGIYRRLLHNAGATAIVGTGRLIDAHTVVVGDERHHAETIVIATGGRPTMPDIPGIELAVSSDAMFDLPTFPERVVIVGGGYIACEFACIMQGLGAQVTQLYRRDLPLRGFDWDLRAVLSEEMRKGGCRPPPQHQRGLPRAQRVRHRSQDHHRRDHRDRPRALRHRAEAQCRGPRAR